MAAARHHARDEAAGSGKGGRGGKASSASSASSATSKQTAAAKFLLTMIKCVFVCVAPCF